jgi:phospholipid/cholesterol/gamma-HCH transport system substrate-binding protein
MRSVSGVGRVAALGAIIAVVVLVGIILFGGADSYTVKATFINAGQLVKGNPVQTGGTPIGSVDNIEITDSGQAEITLKIEDDHAPLRTGTRANIRQFSQSGIANRYVDIKYPPHGGREIKDGGKIPVDSTSTAVDLDQLFNTLDEETRKSLQGFFKNQAAQFRNRGTQANQGLRYLNPSLSTTSRLFRELTKDTPALERFLVDSSRLVSTVAERRDALAALIGNLNDTTRALGDQKLALAESIQRLPPFMRRSNTTFVNLRAALNDVDPLVDASKPVARRLTPFLSEARKFAAGAEPTVKDLSRTIRRRGRRNDLIEFVNSFPPLADITLVTKQRSIAPGGRSVDVGNVRGAFPETVEAFQKGGPELAVARPYTTDFMGWFDDFSTTGGGFDALGALARAHISFVQNFPAPGTTLRRNQFKRCPGSAEEAAPDGSNVLSAEERQQLECEESARAVGPVP